MSSLTWPKWRLPIGVALFGWIITGVLAVVALIRVVAWDALEPFAVLDALTAFVYLPAWIVAIVGAVGRRLVLAGAALLVVVAQILFMLPELTAVEPVPAWAAKAPTIKVMDANVYYENSSMAGYAAQIREFKPELVTLEEATPADARKLEDSGALAGLPYHLDVARFDPKAFFLASKYPLSASKVVYFDYVPLLVQVTVALPTGPQALWVVHTTAPLPVSFAQWKGQLAFLQNLLAERGTARLLMVGDFNATWGSKGFRAILGTGMTNTAAARGKAFDLTWSQTKQPLPVLVRIDHVLTGPGMAVTQIRTDDGLGSDHRDLMATVAIRPDT